MVPAREQLVVFVNDVGELPGLIFYGLSALHSGTQPKLPPGVWLDATDLKPLHFFGAHWQVVGWSLPIPVWPRGDAFRAAIRRTLQIFVDAGARVAWVGAEGVPFCDPPAMLDPECMSGGVLAWLCSDGWFGCPLDPDLPWAAASDEEMLALRKFAGSLATGG